MRNDPCEIKLSPLSRSARPRRPERVATKISDTPLVVDEAFAELPSHRRAPTSEWKIAPPDAVRQQQKLIATLVTQLEALDRQRQQLSRLLDGIDPESPDCEHRDPT